MWYSEEGLSKFDELKFLIDFDQKKMQSWQNIAIAFHETPVNNPVLFIFDYKFCRFSGTCKRMFTENGKQIFRVNVHCGKATLQTVIHTVLHELKHVQQFQNGVMADYDHSIPHNERPQEIEAYEYAEDAFYRLKPHLMRVAKAKTIYDLL